MSHRSPWERALGAEFAQLSPTLRAYFGVIPAGSEGRGAGTFAAVGTPRRWLWPLLALLALDDVVFPIWEREVPFTIVNTPTASGTIRAKRTFQFAAGNRTMVDEVGITADGLVDRLGAHGVASTRLVAEVNYGALVLRSRRTTLRLGRLRIPLGLLSPRVLLREESLGAEQAVSLRLEAPLIGRLYEYAGTFRYSVEKQRG